MKKAGANVLIKGNKCFRCYYEWIGRKGKTLPLICPKCKSPYWNKPLVRKTTSKAVKGKKIKV